MTDDEESSNAPVPRTTFLTPLGLTLWMFLALFLGAGALRADDARPTVESVSDRVMCLCGCVATLNHCPHPETECSMRAEMTALIKKRISEGKSEQAILQEFVDRYGVKVLAAPPEKGFNLAAWVLPGFGLVGGLVCVMMIVRRWRRPLAAPAAAAPMPLDPKVLAAVEEEMKNSGLGTRDSRLGPGDSGAAISSESRIPKSKSR